MAILSKRDPLYKELMATKGKAEIINDKIVVLKAMGFLPARAAGAVLFSLVKYEKQGGNGEVYGGTVGFLCDLPNRRSFSPDAAFYTGSDQEDDMKFLPEAPIFAVEVRSENDYGRRAEAAIAQKIADYFAAGTLVVWDVDLLHDEIISKFTAPDANIPQFFRRGDVADAGNAVPGWMFAVDTLFPATRRN